MSKGEQSKLYQSSNGDCTSCHLQSTERPILRCALQSADCADHTCAERHLQSPNFAGPPCDMRLIRSADFCGHVCVERHLQSADPVCHVVEEGEPVEPGDTLVRAKPFVYAIQPQFRTKICEYCLTL